MWIVLAKDNQFGEPIMKSLLCVDFINEIVDPAGKLAGKGYAAFANDRKTLLNVAAAQKLFRDTKYFVLHARVGFSPTYSDWPERSPLFGKAREFQALKLGSWATEFVEAARPVPNEIVLTKPRVSAFYRTDLDATLRNAGTSKLYIIGVATDLAVEATARDAHDRDFDVTVAEDCCIAANLQDHQDSLRIISKIARVATLHEIVEEIRGM